MIPSDDQTKRLWDKYYLPDNKRVHVILVAKVAMFLAEKLMVNGSQFTVNRELLTAAALLHDIDKNIPKLLGEHHPDTAVRILKEEGMEEVATLVKTHPLHSILDPAIAPKTWEEKILYVSDKMVKQEIITVDERFTLWKREHLPPDAVMLLDKTYPLVKELEQEIFSLIAIDPREVSRLAT